MATSGTHTFRLNIAEVIDEAYERCGVDPSTLTGQKISSARRSLNLLFSEWAVRGINYWATERRTITLVSGTAQYDLPVGTVDVIEAVVSQGGTDYQINRLALSDYEAYPNKATEGRPSQFFLDRQYTPNIRVWPVPDADDMTFSYWQLSQLEDVSASAQDADVPYRWSDALCAGLAAKLALKISHEKVPLLQEAYNAAFEYAASDETERATLRIIPRSPVTP